MAADANEAQDRNFRDDGPPSPILSKDDNGNTTTLSEIYQCSICASDQELSTPIIFTTPDELRDHVNSHATGAPRPFLCDVCQARFNRRSTLWNHKRIHSDVRPFFCNICGQNFKWKNSLKCHEEMHARRDERPSGEVRTSFEAEREIHVDPELANGAKKKRKKNGTKKRNFDGGITEFETEACRKIEQFGEKYDLVHQDVRPVTICDFRDQYAHHNFHQISTQPEGHYYETLHQSPTDYFSVEGDQQARQVEEESRSVAAEDDPPLGMDEQIYAKVLPYHMW